MSTYTVGADPELALMIPKNQYLERSDRGKPDLIGLPANMHVETSRDDWFIPSCAFLEGSKNNPLDLSDTIKAIMKTSQGLWGSEYIVDIPEVFAHPDHVSCEISVSPADTIRGFTENVRWSTFVAQEYLNGQYNSIGIPSADAIRDQFPDASLDHEIFPFGRFVKSPFAPRSYLRGGNFISYCKEWNAYPAASEFGCDPDKSAYEGGKTRIPNPETNIRNFGGHVHVGYPTYLNDKIPKHIVAVLADVFIGAYVILRYRRSASALDRLANTQPHDFFYRQAGIYREKPYGIECRSLDSTWINGEAGRIAVAEGAFALSHFITTETPESIKMFMSESNLNWHFLRNGISTSSYSLIESAFCDFSWRDSSTLTSLIRNTVPREVR